MLVIFYGPSGAGKTTLMRMLAEQRGAYLIPTVMTRQRRPGEKDKVVVTQHEFAEREAGGAFFNVNELFGFKYGTPREAIERAVECGAQELWLLDFPYSKRDVFDRVPHRSFVVVPEGPEELARQLRDAGRAERIESVLNDYREVYAPLISSNSDSRVILNRYNHPDEAITHIVRLLLGDQ